MAGVKGRSGRKKVGRPKKKIDQTEFEKLCGLQCTRQEIADFFDVDVTTLYRWCKETYNESFETISKKKASYGKISLRRTQFELSKKSANMAIWLGKQLLDQEDKMKVDAVVLQDDTTRRMEEFFTNAKRDYNEGQDTEDSEG